MNTLHDKSTSDTEIERKEGQPDLLCSNKKSLGCPSLSYIHVEDDGDVKIAYEILFKAIIRLDSGEL
jgi:hypothetical protein